MMEEILLQMGVLNKGIVDARKAVRCSQVNNTIKESYLILCDIGEEGEELESKTISSDVNEVASCIVANNYNKILKNSHGEIVLNTMNIFIDLCADQEYLNKLRPVIHKKQNEVC